LAIGQPPSEILALDEPRDGVPRGQLDQFLEAEGRLVPPTGFAAEPLAVVALLVDLGIPHLQDFLHLRLVGRRVGLDFFRRHELAHLGLPGGIADKGGRIADEKDDLVAEVLELAQLAQQDGMAQVQIRCRGIKPGLDDEGSRLIELRAQVEIGDDLHGPAADPLKGLREIRGRRGSTH